VLGARPVTRGVRPLHNKSSCELKQGGAKYLKIIEKNVNNESAMSTVEMTVSLPPNLSEDEARLLLAIKLFEVGKVSLGQAARLTGFSKRTFMELLGRYGVPVYNYTPEELREELGL
jgi:predicted HTH domain antitoxin